MDADRPLAANAMQMLRANVAIAADFGEVYKMLRAAGYSDRAIAAAVDVVRPRGDAFERGPLVPPLLRRPVPGLARIDNPKFDAFTLADFLDAGECERLVALIGRHLVPSPLTHDRAGGGFRTSRTCPLSKLDAPVARAVDAKICRTLGIGAGFGEGVQGQWYDVGQQFRAHHDFFVPGSPEYRRFAGLRGNRTWTLMVYLNDGMEGGGTRFPQIDHTVTPRRGLALFWNNLRPDGTPNPDTLHSGEPVTRGHKVILTKWFRVLGDGPLYADPPVG
jgi:prolyl 4-hydroxylase